jgi:thiamine biosynthesis lipoprotein
VSLRRTIAPAVILGLVLLAAVAHLQIRDPGGPARSGLESRPERVMSTSCRLIVVPPAGEAAPQAAAASALRAAEAELRQVEAEMSRYIEASALSRLNRADPGSPHAVPAALLDLLHTSHQLHRRTHGAFDVTCGPLLDLWQAAAERAEVPTEAQVRAARRASNWQALKLGAGWITKQAATVQLDLGGIAKGHGIDRAVQAMRNAGMTGGLVDVGGDLRVFGTPPGKGQWQVAVQNPLGPGTIVNLALRAGAVCTSGSYHRHVTIGGRRFSHILDPRTGWPARGVASTTVLAANATLADGWATALSVLGAAGLQLLPDGVEAMLVVGTEQAPTALVTPGLQARITRGPPYPTREVRPTGARGN